MNEFQEDSDEKKRLERKVKSESKLQKDERRLNYEAARFDLKKRIEAASKLTKKLQREYDRDYISDTSKHVFRGFIIGFITGSIIIGLIIWYKLT